MAITIPPEHFEFLKSVHERLMPVFSANVVPVFGAMAEKVAPYGTCSLLRIADKAFAVTAAHVFDDVRRGCNLFVPSSERPGAWVCLEGQLVKVRDDEVDVAVLALSPKSAAGLRSWRFLRLHEIEFIDGSLPHDWYYVFGYPKCWQMSVSSREQFLAYGSVLYAGPTGLFSDYDEKNHILVEVYTQDNARFDGQPGELPESFAGISGSPMWRSHATPDTMGNWSPEMAKVVAVQTGVYGNERAISYRRKGEMAEMKVKIVKGVRWSSVIDALWQGFPELRPAIRLVRPG